MKPGDSNLASDGQDCPPLRIVNTGYFAIWRYQIRGEP
jgi:hypothetical protein